ncbi:MAG: hypothetical protein HDR54_04485 [Treponema sp.]|nr:hypothetical protein [Treponema sp.]
MKKQFSSFNSLCVSMMTLAMLLTLLAGLASCKNELLEPPDFSDRGAYSSADISAPEVVVATQGGCRSITVSWSPVANAVKYEVYTSKIATGAFEKRTETNGVDKVSVVIREDPDVLAYYKVKAYAKNGNESEFSKMCHGTTLGSPIITNVIQDEFGKSATVRWWCGTYFSADTYKNDVEYLIELYADPEGTTQIAEQRMEGSSIKMTNDVSEGDVSAECTFTDLTPKTTYYYQVKAYLKNAPNDVEESAIVDRETARRLIPNPVEELEATQGVSDKTVTLSFILPDFVDVKESSDVFLKKPLYFEISRAEVEYTASDEIDEKTGRPIYKEGTKPLTDYTVIATIKSAASSEWEAMGSGGNTYYFDCSASTGDNTSGKKLALEKTDSVQSNEGDAEPYIPGYKLTFTDTNAQRGDDKPPVYSYKITSYTDADKKVTSNESVAKTIGWLIGNLKMDLSKKKIEYEYTDEKKTEISKITVKFSCLIEDYGKDYTYIVTQSAVDTNDTPIVDETIVQTMDINELQNFSVVYDLKTDKEGYYSYKFYIAPTGTTNFSDAYYCYDKYKTKTPVTKDVPLEIERFEVEDGYSNKFVIRWSYDKDYAYKLDWTPVVNGVDQEQESMNLAESNENNDPNVGVIKSIANGMATIEHEAQSGDVRKYSISITSRLSIPKELENPSYTLGTATPRQDGYDYDTITIKWDEVQKATSYTLEAWYDGTENPVQTFNTTDLEYKFTPDGSNDAMKAGKKMQVRVIAKNGKDFTKATEIPARLIGPALINASVNSYENAKEDSISLSWSAVEGANGYLIRRVMYEEAEMQSVSEGSDVTYYYNALKGTIVLADEDGNVGERVAVSNDGGRIEIVDTYKEADENADVAVQKYQKAQAKIAWGLPFRYVVLPVLKNEDFEFKYDSLALEEGKVKYENFEKMPTDGTATFGYGLNLVADKATSGTTQKIKWDVPNKLKETQTAIYRRMCTTDGKRNNEFVRVVNFSSNDTDATILVGNDNLCNAFEYIVKYYEKDLTPSPDIKLPDSLFKEFAKQTEEPRITSRGEKIEQKNKGYLLAVDFNTIPHPNPDSQQKYKYADQISWTPWDYNIRAVGPETMELTIRNYNIDAEEHSVFLITADKITGKISVDLKKIDDDTVVEESVFASVYDITSKKLINGNGTASGMLKVLRDLPHYTLTLKNGEETVSYEKNAHRYITSEELVRSATLAIAYGIQQTGPNWKTSLSERTIPYNETAPGSGSAVVKSKGGTTLFVKLTHDFTFTNFTPAMPTRAGERTVFLTIKGGMHGETGGGGSEGQSYAPKTYTNGSFDVSAAEDGCELYKAKITISSLTVNGTSGLKINYPDGGGDKEFGNITPFVFGNGNNKYAANPLADGVEEWK